MTPHLEDEDWRQIAEQASGEMDPVKLTIIVAKLCRALDKEHQDRFPLQQRRPENGPAPSAAA